MNNLNWDVFDDDLRELFNNVYYYNSSEIIRSEFMSVNTCHVVCVIAYFDAADVLAGVAKMRKLDEVGLDNGEIRLARKLHHESKTSSVTGYRYGSYYLRQALKLFEFFNVQEVQLLNIESNTKIQARILELYTPDKNIDLHVYVAPRCE